MDAAVDLRGVSLDALTNADTVDECHHAWSRLQANWDALIDEPASVDALRRTVLQLAVQGSPFVKSPARSHPPLLSPAAPTSGPGSPVGGSFRKQSPVASFVEEPDRIPAGWAWAKIDDCFQVAGGIQKSGKRRPSGNSFPYPRVANFQRARLELDEIDEFELFAGELERYQLEPGDLLVVEGNGSESEIARCARWGGEIQRCVHQNHLIRCRTLDQAVEAFTFLYLNSPTGTAVMRRLAVTTSGLFNLSVWKIRAISMPLPPIEEQQRIVLRVGELMILCDSLEGALSRRARDGEALAASVELILGSL